VVIILDKKEEESKIEPLETAIKADDAPWYYFWR